jgi:hypothetical protein
MESVNPVVSCAQMILGRIAQDFIVWNFFQWRLCKKSIDQACLSCVETNW